LYYRWIDVDESFNKLSIKLKVVDVDEIYTLVPVTSVKKVSLPKNAGSDVASFDNSHALFGYKSSKQLYRLYK
jgi:hypothetical protein